MDGPAFPETARVLLIELMTTEKLGPSELSRRSGIADRTIRRIVRGEQDPSLGTFSRLVEGCGHELQVATAKAELPVELLPEPIVPKPYRYPGRFVLR
jgi:transcriptional regulator with XRE-family HTH domain